MALQSSGAISLDDIHVEVGGTTGTAVSINDTDVRDLISSTAGTLVDFDDFYGASGITLVADLNTDTGLQVQQEITTFSSAQYFGRYADQNRGEVNPATIGANNLRTNVGGGLITGRRRTKTADVFDDDTSAFFFMIADNFAGTHGAATTYISGVTLDLAGTPVALAASNATIFRNNTTGTTRWIWLSSNFSAANLALFAQEWDGDGADDQEFTVNT